MSSSSRFVRYAPRSSAFLLAESSDTLDKARVLAVDAPLVATDGGEGATLTLSVDEATGESAGVITLAGQLGGLANSPDVRGVRITAGGAGEGPTLLTLGAMADGEVLGRDGTALRGVAVLKASGGELTGDLDMGGHKIVDVGTATDGGDAVNYGMLSNYQQKSEKDAPSGYAGVNSDGLVSSPVKAVRAGPDPSSPSPGDIWLNGQDFKVRNNNATPTTDILERQANKNQPNGYAGLDSSGKVNNLPANHASTHATGGADAVSPAAIGAVATGRHVDSGVGLSGGGDLSADRTLAIASFAGLVSKDVDPSSASWSANEIKTHMTLDVGTNGQLIPVLVRLPPAVDSNLVTELVLEYQDATTSSVGNTSTSLAKDLSITDLMEMMMGSLASAANNNGKAVRKISVQTRNTSASTVAGVDLGTFRVRALATPRGSGAGL